ncbi:MAG: acyl-protein synthetase [Firmicutes bacterium]|nr:acyl-protein synthetase [Bacillota bacterium]
MSYMNKLSSAKNPYDIPGTDELFVRAMRENCQYQYDHCADYRRILDSFSFRPEDLKEYDDLAKLPFIPTLYFKHHSLFSMPPGKILTKATSSGTSGNKSIIGYNFLSLFRDLKMVLRLGFYHHLFSWRPTRYIVFGYEPHRSNQMGMTKTSYGQTLFAPAVSRDYALRYTKEGYKLDLENLKSKFVEFASGRIPVRTIGFPAYTYFLLRQMKEEGIRVKLPEGSMISLGGGWKQFYAEQVSKEDFYALAEEVLGIDDKHIVEFFSAVEHPVLYIDCRHHHFHVPVYARVIIRDVDTLEPVPPGTPGLVNLLTPMIDSVPILSIMTDDLGILHEESCGCGLDTPWLEILGRVGIKDIVTCAAGASEMLKGGEGR